MSALFSALALAVFSSTSGSLDPADDPLPKASDLLAKMEAAIGDLAGREKPATLRMKGEMEIAGMGKSQFDESYLGASKVKWTASYGEYGTYSQGSTGEWAWTTDPAFGVLIREGEDGARAARYFAIGRRAPWKSLYDSAETVKRTDFDGRPHYELRMQPPGGGTPDTWFLDCETLLPDGYASQLPNPQGGGFDFQLVFSDWKKVGKVLYPHTKRMEVGGMKLIYPYASIEPGTAVSEADVAPPEDVLAAKNDPKKRTPLAGEHGVCSVEEIVEQNVLSVRATIDENKVSENLATLYGDIGAQVVKAGATFAGPPFARYHKTEGGQIDIEAGIPVMKKAEGSGRVTSTTLPGGKAAVTWHLGPYHELPKTVKTLEAWMKEHGCTAAGGHWEVYWTDPGIEPDPSKWRTQIIWPVSQ